MILKPFFRRHFWLTALVFVAILGLALSLSRFLNRIERQEFFKNQGDEIYTYVNAHRDGDVVEFVRNLDHTIEQIGVPFVIDLVKDGQSVLRGGPAHISDAEKAKAEKYYEHMLANPPDTLLTVHFIPPGKGPAHHGFYPTFAVMVLAIVLASLLSIFILFHGFRDRAELAKTVLTRMQRGDLKARFPVSFLDEAGQITMLFNEMADEIERLVEQLRHNESYRLHLMQELTHDLRTPVSSLRNLIESLRFNGAKLQEKARDEFLDLAYQETEYLTRLTEDLLFLALVLEPKYKRDAGQVSLAELATAQLSAASSHHPKIQFELINDFPEGGDVLTGNAHQIRRLFRNALENAFSFAQEKVTVHLRDGGGELMIEIIDDGPGLSAEGLANFGKKRSTRYQEPTKEGRISVGLGSVIIQVIAQAHGGRVAIHNREDGTKGARLEIRLQPE